MIVRALLDMNPHRQTEAPPPNITVIILAAGRGERFTASGATTHKLDALLGDTPVLEHVIQTVQATGLAWHLLRPPGGTSGMGQSIAQGVKATADSAGWLILPGDLPLVRAESLLRVASALAGHPVVVPYYRRRNGHPVGFSALCFEALTQLSGDAGASSVVRAQRKNGAVLDLRLNDSGILLDVDTVQALRHAQRLLRARQRRAAYLSI